MEAPVDEVEDGGDNGASKQEPNSHKGSDGNTETADAQLGEHAEEIVDDNVCADETLPNTDGEKSGSGATQKAHQNDGDSLQCAPTEARRKDSIPPNVLIRQSTSWSTKPTLGKKESSMSMILVDQICADLRAGRMKAHESLRKALLKGQLNVNDMDQNFASLIMCAAQGGLVEIVADLIFRGVDVNVQDNDMNTPLHAAHLFGHQEMIEMLLSKGADAEKKNLYGMCPDEMKMHAVRALYLEACVADDSAFVLAGLGKNWVAVNDGYGPRGMTLLMCASECGYAKLAKSLVMKKADVNMQDSEGDTAAHHAFRNGHKDVGEYLIQKGMDSSIANTAGTTVVEELALMYQAMVERGEIAAEDVPVSEAMMSAQMTNLKRLFDEFCTSGTKSLGTDAARTGRTKDVAVLGGDGVKQDKRLGRHATMDLLEFFK
jgi:ankyrin repeat protein